MKNVVVTGGYGFIGSNLINRLIVRDARVRIHNIDAVTYAADPSRLPSLINIKNIEKRVEDPEVKSIIADIKPDIVFHLAAESHVDNSIKSAAPFYTSNVLGTLNICEAIVEGSPETKLVHVSTDEVYGSIPLTDKDRVFEPDSAILPNSPYSASKAASDMVVRSFAFTHELIATITRCSNNYGPNQHWEKFIPNSIKCAVEGKPIPVYGDGVNERDWIHVEEHCAGLLIAATEKAPFIMHFGKGISIPNIAIAREIAKELDGTIKFVGDRKGHDEVYRMSYNSSVDLGWAPKRKILDDIPELVAHYKSKLIK